MLQPKRSKHRKAQKGRIREVAKRGDAISFGSYGLKALEAIWLTNRQLEAARQALTRHMKREGNVWIRVFPDKPITKKPQEVRMGKGCWLHRNCRSKQNSLFVTMSTLS